MNSIADGLPPEVHRKIVDTFETFDHEHNKTVDMRQEILHMNIFFPMLQRFMVGKIKSWLRDSYH